METVSDAKVKTVKAPLRFDYEEPVGITWVQEKGDTKSLEGWWNFEELGDGRTRATYGLSADPGRMLGMLLRGPVEGQVRNFLLGGAAEGLKQQRRIRLTQSFTSPLAESLADDVLDRFLRYARVDTQSARERGRARRARRASSTSRGCSSRSCARSASQDAELDDNGYVTATLPGDGPAIGLVAHVDVSPDAPGAGVEPIVHRAYDGGRIELPRGGTVLDPADVPELGGRAGHDVVTSSGDTLLGADDKAGVAEIMAALAHLAAHPDQPRPDAARLLHAGRGGRRGRVALRHRALRRALRLHDGRLDARRAPGRDVLRACKATSGITGSTCIPASRPASS